MHFEFPCNLRINTIFLVARPAAGRRRQVYPEEPPSSRLRGLVFLSEIVLRSSCRLSFPHTHHHHHANNNKAVTRANSCEEVAFWEMYTQLESNPFLPDARFLKAFFIVAELLLHSPWVIAWLICTNTNRLMYNAFVAIICVCVPKCFRTGGSHKGN